MTTRPSHRRRGAAGLLTSTRQTPRIRRSAASAACGLRKIPYKSGSFTTYTMANIKSAAKRARQAETHRQHNMALRSRMRTAIKKVLKAVNAGKADEAAELYKAAVPEIDTMVSKGLVHRNKAARHKSRLNRAVKAIR